MDISCLSILVFNFLLISALPRIFFKKDGKLNLQWWMTATPFLITLAVLIGTGTGMLRPALTLHHDVRVAVNAIAVLLSVSSISLIFFTLGTHRIPIALWHQSNDAPKQIVTWGPYQYVRHPFYAAFLLAFLAALLFSQQVISLVILLYGVGMLTVTARKEERKLSDSAFGDEYRAYMQSTGRFIPRSLRGHHA